MFEDLYPQKIKKARAITLTDCTLFVGIKAYEIDKTYIFMKEDSQKISETGKGWITGYKKSEFRYKGYFSAVSPWLFLEHDLTDRDDIAIIGYDGKYRYHLIDVSVGNNTINLGGRSSVAEFSFVEFHQTIV